MKLIYKAAALVVFLILICLAQVSFARSLKQNGSLWTILEKAGKFSEQGNLKYLFLGEGRFDVINTSSNVFELAKGRLGLGYQLGDPATFWLGYDVNGTLPLDSDQGTLENRFWQRLNYQIWLGHHKSLTVISKIEERKRTDNTNWAYRLREELKLKLIHKLAKNLTPIISDELFFNLNHPDWVSSSTFEQNRAFIGISKALNIEYLLTMGYMNQFRVRSPNNRMTHILYVELRL
jgi:Protein of unknown function (DUF2490)